MNCRVIVGRFRLDKTSPEPCYLLRTKVLGWDDWLGWCDWIAFVNCNGFIDGEVVDGQGIWRWRLCPGEASLLVIMHRKTCNEPFHVEVVLLRLSKDGKLASRVVANTLVKPRDVNKFLGKLTKKLKPKDFNFESY